VLLHGSTLCASGSALERRGATARASRDGRGQVVHHPGREVREQGRVVLGDAVLAQARGRGLLLAVFSVRGLPAYLASGQEARPSRSGFNSLYSAE
jgi:hypothetical protein